MKFKLLLFAYLVLLLSACDFNSYEQTYKDYESFNSINLRNKGWFPKLVAADAYEFKNISYLDSLLAFGVFRYKNDAYYDSVIASPFTQHIPADSFRIKVQLHEHGRPEWFPNPPFKNESDHQYFRKDRFYISRNKKEKVIQFILSY